MAGHDAAYIVWKLYLLEIDEFHHFCEDFFLQKVEKNGRCNDPSKAN